jgi:simple sugar transport system permease protein
MEKIIASILSTAFLYTILQISTPLILAAMGGLVADQSGATNIALEGIMLLGAFVATMISAWTQNPWLGLLAAMLSGILFSALLGVFALNFKANIILVGIALNILAGGLTAFLIFVITGKKGYSSGIPSVALPDIHIPILDHIPVLGSFSNQSIITFLTLISVPAISLFLFRTTLGLRLRAVGSNPAAGIASGISVITIQWIGILISGAMCGLAGAQLSISTNNIFVTNMVQGRGFIAFTAVLLGNRKPVRVFLGALIFGIFDALANTFQILTKVPSQFILIIPYVATLVALIIYSRQARRARLAAAAAMESQE